MHKLKAFLQKRFSTFQAKLKLAFILTSMIPLLLSVFIALSIINSYLEKDAETHILHQCQSGSTAD